MNIAPQAEAAASSAATPSQRGSVNMVASMR
jgi:hypothetical protein